MPRFALLNRAYPRANVITGRGKSRVIGNLINVWSRFAFRKKGGKSPPSIMHYTSVYTVLLLGAKFFANGI